VVGDHLVGPEALLEGVGDPLDQPAGVDEHQGGVMLGHQIGDPVVDAAEQLVRGHRAELVVGHLDGDVELAGPSGVGDVRQRTAGADQHAGDPLDGALGGAEPDPDRRLAAGRHHQALEPLEREGQVGAALVARHRVDLVDNDRAGAGQRCPALLRGEEDVERLGRGDQDVRRPARHLAALGHRRVAGPDRDPDGRHRQPLACRYHPELLERHLEVALDVVGQCLERRDVDHLDGVRQRAGERAPEEVVRAGQKSRPGSFPSRWARR
jgi:hypothetical protein